MFASIKNKMKRDKMARQVALLIAALTVVPEGATTPLGFSLLPEKDAKELVTAEPSFFSINPNVPADANGNVQIAITPAGVAAVNAEVAVIPAAAPAPVAESTPASFAILKGVTPPAIQRGGGRRESRYPFSQLEVGDAFDVNSTAKAFASTISAQNRKYKGERKFTLRTISVKGKDGATTDTVRVYRIAVTKPTAAPASAA